MVPRITDAACGRADLAPRRAAACADLRGRVLEIGFGTGHNVPHYPRAVVEVVAVEPNDVAWRRSRDRRAGSPVPVRRAGPDGQRLDEPDGSYDAVLVTFSLCTIPDQHAALAEVRRVLRPGGVLHLVEHGLAPEPAVVRWQRRLEPVQRRVVGGCHLTRDPVADVRASGLELEQVDQGYLLGSTGTTGPAVARATTYLTVARARRPG